MNYKIKSIHSLLNLDTYYNIENTDIYYTIKSNQSVNTFKIFLKKSNDNYKMLFECSLIRIFCSMTILRDIYLYGNQNEMNKYKSHIAFILKYNAGRTNIVSYQNALGYEIIIDFLLSTNVFIEINSQTSHYGYRKQRVFLSEFIIDKTWSNDRLTEANMSLEVTLKERLNNYYNQDYLVPSHVFKTLLKQYYANLINTIKQKYIKYVIKKLFNNIEEHYPDGVETTNEQSIKLQTLIKNNNFRRLKE